MSLERVLEQIGQAAVRAGRNPASVRLVAVTKGRDPEEIRRFVLAFGDFALGESRVQEALPKQVALPGQAWHFIGPLQRNKIRFMRHFDLVHSLDGMKTAVALSKRASREGWSAKVLLEVNVSGEAGKHGVSPEVLDELIPELGPLPGIELLGLMTMAPLRGPEEVRPVFAGLSRLADRYNLVERSMGMSNDYTVAVEEGATLVRVGRALFEE